MRRPTSRATRYSARSAARPSREQAADRSTGRISPGRWCRPSAERLGPWRSVSPVISVLRLRVRRATPPQPAGPMATSRSQQISTTSEDATSAEGGGARDAAGLAAIGIGPDGRRAA